MSCILIPSTSGNEDFTAAIGKSFTIKMTGPSNSGLVLVSAAYDGKAVTAAPFTFTVAAGLKILFVHFEALVPGAKLQVFEACDTTSQLLETLFFDPGNPGTGYEIAGV